MNLLIQNNHFQFLKLFILLITDSSVKKDLNGTRERVKHALQHEEEPQPHKRKRKSDNIGGQCFINFIY